MEKSGVIFSAIDAKNPSLSRERRARELMRVTEKSIGAVIYSIMINYG